MAVLWDYPGVADMLNGIFEVVFLVGKDQKSLAAQGFRST
jgi:hypothetical protein